MDAVTAAWAAPDIGERIRERLSEGRAPSFSRDAVTADAVDIGETMGLRITAEVTTPDPPDGRALVTVRCESRPLRGGELQQIREALQQRAPIGASVVVRDGAQLDGMRDRALAPIREKRAPITAAALEARLFGERGRPRVRWMPMRP